MACHGTALVAKLGRHPSDVLDHLEMGTLVVCCSTRLPNNLCGAPLHPRRSTSTKIRTKNYRNLEKAIAKLFKTIRRAWVSADRAK